MATSGAAGVIAMKVSGVLFGAVVSFLSITLLPAKADTVTVTSQQQLKRWRVR